MATVVNMAGCVLIVTEDQLRRLLFEAQPASTAMNLATAYIIVVERSEMPTRDDIMNMIENGSKVYVATL